MLKTVFQNDYLKKKNKTCSALIPFINTPPFSPQKMLYITDIIACLCKQIQKLRGSGPSCSVWKRKQQADVILPLMIQPQKSGRVIWIHLLLKTVERLCSAWRGRAGQGQAPAFSIVSSSLTPKMVMSDSIQFNFLWQCQVATLHGRT